MGRIVPSTAPGKNSGIPDWLKPEVFCDIAAKDFSKTAAAVQPQRQVANDVVYSYVCLHCNSVSTADELRRKSRISGIPMLKCAVDGGDLVPHQVVKVPTGYITTKYAENKARFPKDDRLLVPQYVPNQLLDKSVIHRMVNDVGNLASNSGMWDARAKFIRAHRAKGPVQHIASAEIEITYTDQAQVSRTVRTAASVDTSTGKTILPSYFTYNGHQFPFTRDAVDVVSKGAVFEPLEHIPEESEQYFHGRDPARFRDAFASAEEKTLWDPFEAGYQKEAYEDIDPGEMAGIGEELYDEMGYKTEGIEDSSEVEEIELGLFEDIVASYQMSPARRAYFAGLMAGEYNMDELITTAELSNPLARFSGITKEAPSKEKLDKMVKKVMGEKGWTREHAERYVAGGIWGKGKQGDEEGRQKTAKIILTAANMHRCYKCSKYDQNVDHPRNEAEQWQHAVCKKFDTHLGNVLWADNYPKGCELGEVAASTEIDPDYSDPEQVIASGEGMEKEAHRKLGFRWPWQKEKGMGPSGGFEKVHAAVLEKLETAGIEDIAAFVRQEPMAVNAAFMELLTSSDYESSSWDQVAEDMIGVLKRRYMDTFTAEGVQKTAISPEDVARGEFNYLNWISENPKLVSGMLDTVGQIMVHNLIAEGWVERIEEDPSDPEVARLQSEYPESTKDASFYSLQLTQEGEEELRRRSRGTVEGVQKTAGHQWGPLDVIAFQIKELRKLGDHEAADRMEANIKERLNIEGLDESVDFVEWLDELNARASVQKTAVDVNFIEDILRQVAEYLDTPARELGWYTETEIGDALTDLGLDGLTVEEQEYLIELIVQRKGSGEEHFRPMGVPELPREGASQSMEATAKVPDFHDYIEKHQTWDQLKNLVVDLAVASNMPCHFDLKKVPTMSRDELEQRLTELMDRSFAVGIASAIPMLKKFGFEFYGKMPEGDYAVILPDGMPEILTEAELLSFGQEGERPGKRPSRYKKDIPKRHPTHPRTIPDAPQEMEAQLADIESMEERLAEIQAVAARMVSQAQEEAATYLGEEGAGELDAQILNKWKAFREKVKAMQDATVMIKDRIFSSFTGDIRSPRPKPEAFRDALIAKFPDLEATIEDLYKKARAYQLTDSFIEVQDVPEKTRDRYRGKQGAVQPEAGIDELLDIATHAEDQLAELLEALGG